MKTRWVTVDTRHHTQGGRCLFDGFIHLIPRARAPLHEITMNCWCEPKMSWLEEAGTILISHRNRNPDKD